jgi:hypothetical protein
MFLEHQAQIVPRIGLIVDDQHTQHGNKGLGRKK